MPRPEAERRFLRTAQQEGYLELEEAVELVERLEERGEVGLHAIRDLAIRTKILPEKIAYRIFTLVSQELREIPDGIAQIGSYAILERIGRGSMGVVYRGRHVSLGKEVALKILPPRLSQDPVFVERFLREARAAGRLNHPNVVAALDAGYADGFHYFVMELVSGSSLKEIVEEHGPIEEREALKVAFFVVKALRHAHENGIIHRDIKPANIMVTADGRVKLTDLGLARVVDTQDCSLTQHGRSVGTPYYMSPEQAVEDREIDARCDIYALGCTLYYMLTGRPPYDAPAPSGILAKHVAAPIPDPRADVPGISEPTARLVMHMMAKRPEQRPQTPRDVIEVLREILAAPDATATLPAVPAMPVVPAAAGGAAAAAAAPAALYAGSESFLSAPELRTISSGSLRRIRRGRAGSGRTPARGSGREARAPSSSGALAFLALGALVLAGGAMAYGLLRDGAPRDVRAATVAERAPAVVAGAAPAGGVQGGAAAPALAPAAAAPGPAKQRPTLSSPSKSQEVLDREAAEAAAREREARQPEIEAARLAAEAERLAKLAREERKAEERRAGEAAAEKLAADAARHAAVIAEIAPEVAAGKLADVVARLERALAACETDAVRTRAALDLEAVRAALGLRALALEAFEKKIGEDVEIALRAGASIHGKVASVAREQARVTIELARSGAVEAEIDEIADRDLARAIQTVLGFSHTGFLVGEGARLAYAGDPERGRALLAKAAEKGDERAKRLLARVDELPRPAGAAEPEGPVVAEAPAPARGAATTEARPADPEPAAPAVAALTSDALLKLFEVQPEAFAADGRVRFRYEFLGKLKRLGGDFEVAGGEVRFDPSIDVLRLEGTRRVVHKAVFRGDVRVEAEVIFMDDLRRGSSFSLFLEEPRTHAVELESIFGLALVERKKGRTSLFGPKDALEVAYRDLKPYTAYHPVLALEGARAVAGLDGAVGGHADDVAPQATRRVGMRFENIDGQIRSLTVEGKLDLAWVWKEIQKRASYRTAR